jgi:DedD protein
MRDERHLDRIIERPQVVWFTLGGLTALGLMFAAGYVVGRRAARIEAQPEAAAPDRLAQIQADQQMHDKLTFYDELTDPKRDPPPPVPKPAPAPLVAQPKPVAAAAAPAAPAPAPKPAAPATPPNDVKRAMDAGPAQPGEYTVQVSSFQSLPEAQAFAAGLERRGFRPFVVTGAVPGRGTWYRVRVGRFGDEASAKAAKTLLAASDIPAWVLKTE